MDAAGARASEKNTSVRSWLPYVGPYQIRRYPNIDWTRVIGFYVSSCRAPFLIQKVDEDIYNLYVQDRSSSGSSSRNRVCDDYSSY